MPEYENEELAGSYNVGPDDCDCVTTGELCDLFEKAYGEGACWHSEAEKDAPHEASFLKLDNSKLKDTFGLHPVWHIDQAIGASADWTRAWLLSDKAANEELIRQVKAFAGSF